MNPDPDTTRIVRAEAFGRHVARLMDAGLDRTSAELQVALLRPDLACAYEQSLHPDELHPFLARVWFGD